MEIRPARVEDVEAVLPLVGRVVALHASWDEERFGADAGVAEMYRGWLRGRCADDASVFLVAEREGRIVAFLVATVESSLPIYRVARYGYVHDLWVEPPCRDEGVGRSMTMLALERFKVLGVTQVRLETAAGNEAARAMFARCGFRPSAVEMLCAV